MLKNETVEESIVLLDFEPDIGCESLFHETSEFHEGAAEFFQRGPCLGSTGYRCGKYVRSALDHGRYSCAHCGDGHDQSEISFAPLSAN